MKRSVRLASIQGILFSGRVIVQFSGTPWQFCRIAGFAGIISLMLIAAGCQTNRTVSLQEAKSISSKFQDLSLRIPTRAIRDGRMDRLGINRFEYRQPACESNAVGLNYYQKTALVLTAIYERGGDLSARNSDEEKILKQWEVEDLIQLVETIAKAYERQGDFVPALHWMKRSIDLAVNKWGGPQTGNIAQLAYLAAVTGDTKLAFTLISKLRPEEGDRWENFWYSRGRGAYLEAVGRLEEAAREFEVARKLIRKLDPDNPRYHRLISHLGWISLKQGRLVESEALLVKALEGSIYRVNELPIRNSYSAVLYEQGRYEEAADMAKLNIYLGNSDCIPENSGYRAEARKNLARAMMALGQWKEAAQQFGIIKEELQSNLVLYAARFEGTPDHALSLIQSGSSEYAIEILEKRVMRLKKLLGSKHYDTVETSAFLAMANAAIGNYEKALKLFTQSVPLMLQRSRQSETYSEGSQSITFKRRTVLEHYISLLADIRGSSLEATVGIDAASEAFKLADAARSSTVERLLARSSARSASLDPQLSILARKEQDLQRQISAQWASLSAGTQNGVISGLSTDGPRVIIDDLRVARAAIMEEIENKFPDYADTINPSRISIKGVRSLLRKNERLLSVYMGDQKTFVWSVSKFQAAKMYVIDRSRNEMEELIADIQQGLDTTGISVIGDIPEFNVMAAQELFQVLFSKDSNRWQTTETLIYIPHSSLSTLPLAVLPKTASHKLEQSKVPLFSGYRDIDWIINDFDIATLPSVSSLRLLRKLEKSRTKQFNFAGFGDPIFSNSNQNRGGTLVARGAVGSSGSLFRSAPSTKQMLSANLSDLPQLPSTGDEIRELAVVMKADINRDLFLGVHASEESVKSTSLNKYKIIAFATHGLVSGDLNGLRQPALALSSPQYTGGKEDGLLTMDEIMSLSLDADWVILSACNTGAADGSGAEAISGLGGAFFYAGARALFVTYWPVETTSARMITTELFRRQSENVLLARSEATRQAYRYLIEHEGFITESGKVAFSYAHPIFWAAFGLIGLPEI